MSFHQEHIETFLSNFNKKKEEIRKSAGCNLLELYRDKNDSSIFFTYSYWDSEERFK
jgi:quinol monooxygenase YgiN